MTIEEFHNWIWDWNRFNVTAYNISTCFWPWWSSVDLWPFIAKNTDFSFLIFHAGRNYIFETDSYEYKYIKKIEKYNKWLVLTTEKIYDSFNSSEKIKIQQEIFIKKLCKNL